MKSRAMRVVILCVICTFAYMAKVSVQASVKVSMELEYTEDGKQGAKFQAVNDQDGKILWEKNTDYYPATELDAFSNIGTYQKQFIYVENGSVAALSMKNGKEKWRNDEHSAGGGVIGNINKKGLICLSGYYGPAFWILGKNGKTMAYQELSDYFWPFRIANKVEQNEFWIYFEQHPEDKSQIYVIDTKTFSHQSYDEAYKTSDGIEPVYTDEQICSQAKAYYYAQNEEYPDKAVIRSKDGNMVTIWLYDEVDNDSDDSHTTTLAYYEVSNIDATGEDTILGEEIDLKSK